MKLNIIKTKEDAILELGKLYFCDVDDDIVIPPNSVDLFTTGISIKNLPAGYKFDIELIEDIIDSDIILLGRTIAPKKFKEELGLIVYNLGKKAFRLESGKQIATYGLIKYEKLELEDGTLGSN